jgi:ATP-dependent Lhr-like helicase
VHERGRVLVAAERVPLARAAYGGASLEPAIEAPRGVAGDVAPEEAVATIVRGVLACSGPATAEELSARLGLPLATVEAGLARVESEGQVLRGRFRPAPADGAREVEWCDRGLLARIHRLTIGKLRREIEPVSTADFLRFLLRWQHVAPGTQLHGEEGVLRVIEQLQGFQAAAGAWEDEILRARIGGYRPEWLDALCLSGEVAWGRLDAPRAAGAAIRAAAPIGVALRDALPWLVEGGDDRPAPEGLSHAARDVLEYLRRRGASFLPELVAGSGRLRTEVDEAVRELVAAGLVTADGFQALRSLLARPELRRRAATRARRTGGPRRREAQGRWSLFRAPAPPPPAAEVAERFARQLLARYGVVCRDILGRESRAPGWRDLLLVYRRLEARGEVRGGRFVAGAPGEHFALPAAVEALRAVRRAEPRGETVRVAASDPLNLAGILTPGPRIAAGPGRGLVYREGVPEVLEPAAGRGAAPLEAVPRP